MKRRSIQDGKEVPGIVFRCLDNVGIYLLSLFVNFIHADKFIKQFLTSTCHSFVCRVKINLSNGSL